MKSSARNIIPFSATALLLLIPCLLSPIKCARAAPQQLLDVAELPDGVLPLPDPGSGSKAGVIIDGENAPNYKAILLPELYRHIRAGELFIDAASRLRYVWRRHDDWEKESDRLNTLELKVSENGLIDAKLPLQSGFPFGSGSSLLEQWQKNPQFGLGPRLLWNLSANFWGLGAIETSFQLNWLNKQGLFRSSQGRLSRVYPTRLSSEDSSEQLFREILSFDSPEALRNYKLLSYRFRGEDEDMLWLHSPVNGKVRQLTGSNRSDPLITSALSADDYLCWSGKIGAVRAENQAKPILLAPFPSVDLETLHQSGADCHEVKLQEQGGSFDTFRSPWNFESRRFPGAAGWVPTRVVFVPRQLWKVELVSRDPYALHGRQVLYIDTAMQLPVYKITYDRAGTLWKTSLCAFGLAANQDRTLKVPYLAYSVVLDHKNDMAYTLEYGTSRYCSVWRDDLKLADFTPAAISSQIQ